MINNLPKDIEKIILDYKYDFEIFQIKKNILRDIKEINYIVSFETISFRDNTQYTLIKDDIEILEVSNINTDYEITHNCNRINIIIKDYGYVK